MLLFLAAVGCSDQSFHTTALDDEAYLDIAVDPSRLSFGDVPVGQSAVLDFRVTNVGELADTIEDVVFSGSGVFTVVDGPALPLALEPEAEASFTIAFTPVDLTASEGLAHVGLGVASPKVVALDGQGVDPSGDTVTDVPPVKEIYDPADDPIYAHTSYELFTVVPSTGEADLIGRFEEADGTAHGMHDIAIDPAGRMIGGKTGDLWWIDPHTAEVTFACALTADYTGLAFSKAGTLFSGSEYEIVKIDPDACTEEHFTTGSASTAGDLVGLPDGFLYWTVNGTEQNVLLRVDPQSGAVSTVAELDWSGVFGLSYFEDRLYAFTSYGVIAEIDPNTGQTLSSVSSSQDWYGAATNILVW